MMLSIFIVLLFSVQSTVFGAPKVPCFFIFGDSLVDSGNNNKLLTQSKGNYPPYGIDFPKGPTGRFSNGRTVADIIGQQLGLTQFITPFAYSLKANVTQGVNYASGSAGIREETGKHMGEHVSLYTQLKNHRAIRNKLLAKLGRNAALKHLNKCFYYVGIGSNDYINNYFLPEHYHTKSKFTLEQYAKVLTDQLTKQLNILYKHGARKIAVVGVGYIGCTPDAIKRHVAKQTTCVEEMNIAITLYNNNLKSLVSHLNNDLVGASLTFVNVSAVTAPGYTVMNMTPCCLVKSNGLCTSGSDPCHNRNRIVFFDGFHPTEAVNEIVAKRAFNTLNPIEAYPVPISKLFQH